MLKTKDLSKAQKLRVESYFRNYEAGVRQNERETEGRLYRPDKIVRPRRPKKKHIERLRYILNYVELKEGDVVTAALLCSFMGGHRMPDTRRVGQWLRVSPFFEQVSKSRKATHYKYLGEDL